MEGCSHLFLQISTKIAPNTAPRSLTKTGPWPSILAKGTHTRAQREHFLARSAVYFWVSLTFTVIPSRGCDPRECWKACRFILGGWVRGLFPGICGSHRGSVSCEAAVTSVICVSLLSGCSCQRYGRPHLFFYEWTL